MEAVYGQLISWVVTFFMVGIPTFFITKKYGRNFKRDWILILIPIGIWMPIFIFGGFVDSSDVYFALGEVLALTMIWGTIGYFVFRQKKKIKAE